MANGQTPDEQHIAHTKNCDEADSFGVISFHIKKIQ